MKYVHVMQQFIKPEGGEKFAIWYMVVSDDKELHPGHHVMTPCTLEQAKAYAARIGAELVGTGAIQTIKVTKPAKPRNNQKSCKGVKRPNAKCLDDARKACGVKPYNQPGNYLMGDGYFSKSCRDKYGEYYWNLACKMVREE